jgi:hypothetical protein
MTMRKIISFMGGENCYSKTKNYFEQTAKTYSLIYHNFLYFFSTIIFRVSLITLVVFALFEPKNAPKSSDNVSASSNISFWLCSDYDRSDDAPTSKNPMAAAGAVKDALATGGVDKVFVQQVMGLFGLICV